MFGFYYHFTKNIDLKFMSNMSFYDDDQDNEIGPAPACPAELAHNMSYISRQTRVPWPGPARRCGRGVSDGGLPAAGGRFRQPESVTGQSTVLPAHSGLRHLFTTEEWIRSVTRNCPIWARAAGPASRNMHNGREICQCQCKFAELPSD